MPEWLAHLLGRYGYAIVFGGVLLENAGLPVPGETVLLAAAFFAHQGAFALPKVIGVAVAAAILGDNLGYWIGRRGGRALAERHGRLVGLTAPRLAALDAFFDRHGAATVFLARFVSGLRVFAALFAGMSGLPWPRFLVYNAAGALAWATTVGVAGYLFGQSWGALERWIGRTGLFGVALAIALVVIALMRRRRQVLLAGVWAQLPGALTRRAAVFAGATLGAIGLFAKIAEDVVEHETTGFDSVVSGALHRLANPMLDVAVHAFTALGTAPVVLIVVLGVTGWSLCRRDRRAAATLVAVSVATEGLILVLKLGFHRVRPVPWTGVATPESYSFPSGHAMAAAAIYGMVAVVLARLHPRLARPAVLLTPLLILMIGVSRVYLGVHWPTDVLAGFAAGAFLLGVGMYVLDRPNGSPQTTGRADRPPD